MKKHNEGYTLPLVMVVMVILCLVAVSIMSVALRNLKAQQASVQRMQDQYVAAGMIEKVVAQLESIEAGQMSLLDIYTNAAPKTAEKADEEPETSLEMYLTCSLYTESGEEFLVSDVYAGSWSSPLIVKLVAKSNQVQVTCELELKCNFSVSDVKTVNSLTYYNIAISAPESIEYISYEVDYITTSETGGGQE